MGLIPPLNRLRLFEAAGRCGSFKLAARELNITPGAVSHGVNALEKWLDVELFDRRRGLVLTQAGLDYLSYISKALLTIANGTNEISAADQNTHDSSALPAK